MADVTSADIVELDSRSAGDRSQKECGQLKLVEVTVTSAGDGTATHLIPASAFGFTKILYSSPWTKVDNSEVLVANFNWIQEELLLKGIADNDVANYTGRYKAWVFGY